MCVCNLEYHCARIGALYPRAGVPYIIFSGHILAKEEKSTWTAPETAAANNLAVFASRASEWENRRNASRTDSLFRHVRTYVLAENFSLRRDLVASQWSATPRNHFPCSPCVTMKTEPFPRLRSKGLFKTKRFNRRRSCHTSLLAFLALFYTHTHTRMHTCCVTRLHRHDHTRVKSRSQRTRKAVVRLDSSLGIWYTRKIYLYICTRREKPRRVPRAYLSRVQLSRLHDALFF